MAENPYTSPQTPEPFSTPELVDRQAPPIAEGRLFKAWAVYYLVSIFGAVIAGAVVGGIVGGVIGGIWGVTPETTPMLQIAGKVAGFVVSIPVSYLCFRWVVRHYFAGQR